ncbi:MAG: hypothetical protein F6J90_17470 [Moorea sp. SIOASIH]|nr:hypothetical protein [Moorena sp. SIOASIH]
MPPIRLYSGFWFKIAALPTLHQLMGKTMICTFLLGDSGFTPPAPEVKQGSQLLEFCDWPLGHATRTHPSPLPDVRDGSCYNN